MPSIHSKRWIDNLIDSNHEIYWFDILNRGEMDFNNEVIQIVDWQTRKKPYIKGEHFLRKKLPRLYNSLETYFQVTISEKLEEIILQINPDCIHSFEMQSCSYPILKTMNKFPKLKWIYSCWGSDLFYYQNFAYHKSKIKAVLKRVNFLQTDCNRDINIAKSLGFSGVSLEIIPGGTGFDLQFFEKYCLPFTDRKIILVKGYQHKFGRAINILEVLVELHQELSRYEVVIFGAHKIVIDFVNNKKMPYKVFDRNGLNHNQVLEFMGKSLIYIGNSISDGMPNTLLEAITMGTFPIQSNPGNVTSEIIEHGKNGFLINNPNNKTEIKNVIINAINDKELLISASKINKILAQEKLNYHFNNKKVIDLYKNTH